MPDRPAPDQIERQLARLAAAGERLAHLPGADEIRRRAHRRQRARAAGAALSLALLAALAFEARTLLDRNQAPLLPVAPVPSATSGPAATTTPNAPTTTLPPTTRPVPTTTAPPRTTLATGARRFSLEPSVARPGQRVTLTGSGCAARTQVTLVWSVAVNPVNFAELGTATTGSDGSFRTHWVVPEGMLPGPIRIEASCGQRFLPSAILTVARA